MAENEIVVLALPLAGTLMTSGETWNSVTTGAVQVTVPAAALGLLKDSVCVVAAPPTLKAGKVMVLVLAGVEVIGSALVPSTKLKVSMPM